MFLFNTVRSTLATLATCVCMGTVFHLVVANDAQAQRLVNDYTIGKALKEVKCGRRDLYSTQRWLGQMGVTDAYLSGPAMQSVEFHKGYQFGSPDC